MNDIVKNALIGLGSFVWGLVVLVVGLDVAFPSEKAKTWLRYQVETRSKQAWTFDATDIDLWRLSGVTAQDLVVYKVARRGRAIGDTPPLTPFVQVEELSARAEILPLIARLLPGLEGALRFDYSARIFGSDIEGVVGSSGTMTEVLALADDLDLSKVPIEGESWSIDLTGNARLDVDLEVDQENIENSRGHLKLDVADLVLVGGQAMGSDFASIADGIFPAQFSEAVLEFEVEDGKAEVKKGSFVSEPVEMEISGDIQLRKDLARSRINLEIKLKLADSVDKLARLVPTMSSARQEDGSYALTATGTVLAPRFREDRASSSRTTSTRSRTPTAGREDRDEDSISSASAEDRQKARQERLERMKERREKMRDPNGDATGRTPTEPALREAPMPDPFQDGEGPGGFEDEPPELDYLEEEPMLPPDMPEYEGVPDQGYIDEPQ